MTQVYTFFNTIKTKMKYVDYFLAVLFSIFIGVKTYLLTVAFLFLFDTILGVATLKKRKENFSLNKLLTGILVKIVFYTPAVVSLYAIDVFLLGEIAYMWFPIENFITKFGTFIVLSKELISINRLTKILFGKSVTEDAEKIVVGVKKYKDKIKDVLE